MRNVAIKGKYKVKDKTKFLGTKSPIYRSMWERRFMLYCDRCESIKKWSSESIHIPYISPKDNKVHNYYPDFYVEYVDKKGGNRKCVIEIKPFWQCKWAVNKAKWDAARIWCRGRYEFKVLTEKELYES